MAINIDFFTGYAKASTANAAWWSGKKRKSQGQRDASFLMKQWGLGYGKDGLETIPYSYVRTSNSDNYVPCEDLENIVLQASNKYDEAYETHADCCGICKECKGRAVIDMSKWSYIRNWAEGAIIAQSETYGYDTCQEEDVSFEEEKTKEEQDKLLNSLLSGGELSNTAILGIVGGVGVVLTLLIIRATRK